MVNKTFYPRDFQDNAVYQGASKNAFTSVAAVMVTGTTIFTVTGGPIFIQELVSLCVTANDATASTLQWSADGTVGAATTFTGATASLASAVAGTMAICNLTALSTAPDLVVTIVITRDIAIELTTHIPPSGPLDIPAINLQFSKLVAMMQKVDDNRVRSLRQPDSDDADMGDLPTAALRALAYLAFDANGDPVAAANPAAYPASVYMATVLAAANAAAARSLLGVVDQASYAGASNFRAFR